MTQLADYLSELSRLACDVLQTSVFAFGFPCSREETLGVERGLAAQIEFAGPVSGTLTIAAPRALCADLTADLLALDADEVADEQTADTFKELANIICGQLATALCGEEPVVALSIPQTFPLGANGWRDLARRGGSTHLLVEERPVVLNLAIR
jgi:hypothetical protein